MRTMSLSSFSLFALLTMCTLIQCVDTVSSTACEKTEDEETRCVKGGKRGVCISNECLIAVQHTARKVLLKVRYNKTNSYITPKYENFTMWLRGNSMGLNWMKGRKLKQSGPNTWHQLISLNIVSTPLKSDGKQAFKFEFRLYLNDEKDMLGANFHISLPLSMSPKHHSDLRGIPAFFVYPWFFIEKGTETKRIIYSPQLRENRNITMYTPPSFHENQYKRYETLYFNDGQRVGSLLPQIDALIVRSAYLKEIIIVGVVNTFEERVKLLAPTNGSDVVCKVGGISDLCGNCVKCDKKRNCSFSQRLLDFKCYDWIVIPEPKGQRYLDFIQNTLIPEAQKSYRALPGPENVGIVGFSFGGLVACHAMWTRPGTFGSAACMSSSFWWPFSGDANKEFPNDSEYEFVKSTLRGYRGARAHQKVYIDVGSDEGLAMIDPARNTTRILDASPYFKLDKNLWFYIWPNEFHSYNASLKRIWVALLALYGAEGSPNAHGRSYRQPTTADSIPSTACYVRLNSYVRFVVMMPMPLIVFLQTF